MFNLQGGGERKYGRIGESSRKLWVLYFKKKINLSFKIKQQQGKYISLKNKTNNNNNKTHRIHDYYYPKEEEKQALESDPSHNLGGSPFY